MTQTRFSSAARFALPALALGALGLAAGEARADVGVGDRAVEFRQVVDEDGEGASLREERGAIVVVTFGASWCDPCEKELPAFEDLAEHYAEAGADVTFFAVNVDSELSTGRAFMDQFDFEHADALFDPNRATVRLYAPPAMPSTFIIDSRGLVRVVHEGYRPGDEDELREAVDQLL